MKNCKLRLVGSALFGPNYSFTLENLELMVSYGIRIIEIRSFFLKTEGDINSLLKFAEIMRNMKHLEEFRFSFDDFEEENAPPMELLTHLPFNFLMSHHFKIVGRRDVVGMTKIVSQIKSLRRSCFNSDYFSGFHLKRNYVSDYLLTPEDFKSLKNLPVTHVDLHALDLKKENIKNFREIMKLMKIRDIEYEKELYEDEDFEIYVEDFGPDGIYSTIKDVSS